MEDESDGRRVEGVVDQEDIGVWGKGGLLQTGKVGGSSVGGTSGGTNNSETKEETRKERYGETFINNPDHRIAISSFTNKFLKLSIHVLRNVMSLVLLSYPFATHRLLYENKGR